MKQYLARLPNIKGYFVRFSVFYLIMAVLLSACGENTTPFAPTPSPGVSAQTATVNTPLPAKSSTPAATIVSFLTQTVAPATSSNSVSPITNSPTASGSVITPLTSAASAQSQNGFTPHTFEHVFIIVLENTDYKQAAAQPYLISLAKQGSLLTNFHAITHPSYPNYLALVAGSTFGITSDQQTDLAQTSLVDLMETAHVSWKAYVEQLPSQPCFKAAAAGTYARKHLPFLSFTNIQQNPARCSKIVPATQLTADLTANSLANYSLYIPDLNNDGHDTGVGYAAKWLQGFLPPLLQKAEFIRNTLVVITFDEDNYGDNNRVYTTLLGEMIKPASSSDTGYNYYNLLRTIEDNFQLGNLGREDARATDIAGIWTNSH